MHPTHKAMRAQGRLRHEPHRQLHIGHHMRKIAKEAQDVVHKRHVGDGLALLVRPRCRRDLQRQLRQLEKDARAGVAAHAVQERDADEDLRLQRRAEIEGEVANGGLERQHEDGGICEAAHGRGGDVADAGDGGGVVRDCNLEAIGEREVDARVYGDEEARVEEGADDRDVRDRVGLQGDGGEVDGEGVAGLGSEPGGGELDVREEVGGCQGDEAVFHEAEDVVRAVGGGVVAAEDEGAGLELERPGRGAVDATDREAWWDDETFGICDSSVVEGEHLRVEELEAYVLDYARGSGLFCCWRRGEGDIGC